VRKRERERDRPIYDYTKSSSSFSRVISPGCDWWRRLG